MEGLTIEEENIKLKYLLRASMAETKKREQDLKPLNFKIGELKRCIDELKHENKELTKLIAGNINKGYKKENKKVGDRVLIQSKRNDNYLKIIMEKDNEIELLKTEIKTTAK
jgi:predicted RNase H-like nuclease (RuvC/YqgF family)|tara:strand:- start:50 stop:385 length:336 start_codon:yes stop_codon:yes gene_type:complete